MANGKDRQAAEKLADKRDFYREQFWVPDEARWQYIRDDSREAKGVGDLLNKALAELEERDTPPSTAWSSTSTSTARSASAPSRTRACSSSSTTSPGTGCATRTSSSPTSSAPPTST